jgi:hypothetical protein
MRALHLHRLHRPIAVLPSDITGEIFAASEKIMGVARGFTNNRGEEALQRTWPGSIARLFVCGCRSFDLQIGWGYTVGVSTFSRVCMTRFT